MSEKQRAKETAMYIAVRNGFGLFKRGSEIHKIYAIGTTKVLCTSQNKDMLWRMACEKLQDLYGLGTSEKALEPQEDTYWEEILPTPEPRIIRPSLKEIISQKEEIKPKEKIKPKEVKKPKRTKKKSLKPKVNFELPNSHLSWKEKRELLWEQQRKERENKKRET